MVCYEKHFLKMQNQKVFTIAQTIKTEFKLSANFPAGVFSYAWVSINELISIIKDTQKQFSGI